MVTLTTWQNLQPMGVQGHPKEMQGEKILILKASTIQRKAFYRMVIPKTIFCMSSIRTHRALDNDQ